MPDDLFRIYDRPGDVLDDDGYPLEWDEIKDEVRTQADYRCVRCMHPYLRGMGEWSRCDRLCRHSGQIRLRDAATPGEWRSYDLDTMGQPAGAAIFDEGPTGLQVRFEVEARWRILTVHHLNGVKHDCRWWNLVALCQRCHLRIQGRVQLERVWPWEHSGWFKPYVAGWYAWSYEGRDIDRSEALARMDELLAHERQA